MLLFYAGVTIVNFFLSFFGGGYSKHLCIKD